MAQLGREAVALEVPIQVDLKFGRSWGDAVHTWGELCNGTKIHSIASEISLGATPAAEEHKPTDNDRETDSANPGEDDNDRDQDDDDRVHSGHDHAENRDGYRRETRITDWPHAAVLGLVVRRGPGKRSVSKAVVSYSLQTQTAKKF